MRHEWLLVMAALLLCVLGCETPDELARSYVDRPSAVLMTSDSVRIGQLDTIYAVACPPTYAICVGRVRGLQWRVHPDNVVIVGSPSAEAIMVRGVVLGRAWVIASGVGGADSVWLRVVP